MNKEKDSLISKITNLNNDLKIDYSEKPKL